MIRFLKRLYNKIFKIHSPSQEWILVPNKDDDGKEA